MDLAQLLEMEDVFNISDLNFTGYDSAMGRFHRLMKLLLGQNYVKAVIVFYDSNVKI